jgi:hypothetical protein
MAVMGDAGDATLPKHIATGPDCIHSSRNGKVLILVQREIDAPPVCVYAPANHISKDNSETAD